MGAPVSLSVKDFLGLLRDRTSWTFIVLVLLGLAVGDPFAMLGQTSLWQILLFWPAAVLIYLALITAGLTVCSPLARRWPDLPIPLPLISVFATLPGVIIGDRIAAALSGGARFVALDGRMLLLFGLVQVFETVFFLFVLNQTAYWQNRSDAAQPHAAVTDGDDDRTLVIGAERVPVARVLHIEAREHYVRVTLDGESITQRARLSDIVAQTAPEDGVQPHRSWWVSKRAAHEVMRDGTRHVMKLTDDTLVPVARTRLGEVQTWVARHIQRPQSDY